LKNSKAGVLKFLACFPLGEFERVAFQGLEQFFLGFFLKGERNYWNYRLKKNAVKRNCHQRRMN